MTYVPTIRSGERGDVAVYISLIVLTIILSSALVFSLILVRQLRATEDAIESERAFYVANSGLEAAFYQLTKDRVNAFTTSQIRVSGEIPYHGFTFGVPAYDGLARCLFDDQGSCQPCVKMKGIFHDVERRIELIPNGCTLQITP